MRNVKSALSSAIARLGGSDSPTLDAELLLAHVLETSRAALRARPERPLTAEQAGQLEDLIDRRAQGEPVAYLLGRAGFMDFELAVNPSVLIPRPETELLVELALETLADSDSPAANQENIPRIADLGTGSGAIAIALARHNPAWRVEAVDISKAALALARRNAQALGVGNIHFHQASWCEGLPPTAFDLIVANPPYVAKGDPALHPDCAFEPETSLFAAEDGLAALRQIITTAKHNLKPQGWLILEHAHNQQIPVTQLLAANNYRNIEPRRDHAHQDRLIRARWWD